MRVGRCDRVGHGSVVARFTRWNDLTKNSPDIVIARCTTTPPDASTMPDGMGWADIEVMSVLKGDTRPGRAQMVSQYWLHQGERFLMFATYQSNELYRAYNATEAYRLYHWVVIFRQRLWQARNWMSKLCWSFAVVSRI